MLLLAAVLFLNYVDRGALPTASNLVQSDLHLSKVELGLLFSALYWTYTPMQLLAGWAGERFGAARVLALGLAIWAMSTMLAGVACGFVTLLLLRLTLGVGESAGFPCSSRILAATVPVGSLGIANGITALGYLLGPAAGTYFGGLLIEGWGWRGMFVAFGAISLVWLLPWARVGIRAESRPTATGSGPPLSVLVRQRGLWATGLGHFASNYTFYFMLNWLPVFLVEERGFTQSGMTQLAGSAYLVNALSAVAGGWLIDRYIARGGAVNAGYKSVMGAAQLATMACMLGMAVGSQPVVLLCMFLYQVVCGAASPGVFAIAQIFAGKQVAGRWVGIQNMLGNIAGIIAPTVTGFVAHATGHFAGAFLLAAAISCVGLAGWTFMLPRIREIDWAAQTASRSSIASTRVG